MIPYKIFFSAALIVVTPSLAFAQTTTRDNKALQQLKDVERSSQDAARTANPERSKAKSNQNIDTAPKPSVRAGTPSTQSKAERDAAAIKLYTSKPPTGASEAAAIARKKRAEPPSPTSAPKTAAAPATAPKVNAPKPVVTAPRSAAAPATRAASTPSASVRPSTVTTSTAPVRVQSAPPRPSTATTTSSPSSSSSSNSSSSRR